MRLACLLILIAACDFTPPPQKAPTAPSTTPTVAAPVPAVPPPPPAPPAPPTAGGAAVGSAGSTAPCLDAAVRIAQILIDGTTDIAQKAAIEQDRSKIVKKVAETCTRDSWSAEILGCIAAAKTQVEAAACTKDLKSP